MIMWLAKQTNVWWQANVQGTYKLHRRQVRSYELLEKFLGKTNASTDDIMP